MKDPMAGERTWQTMSKESDNCSAESRKGSSVKNPGLYDVSILERSAQFADRIVRLTLALPKTLPGGNWVANWFDAARV